MRKFNATRLIVWIVVFIATVSLWGAATYFGFIGDTAFIGHVSMVALVLTAGAAIEASLPDFDPKEGQE